jgi:hypothetical protein
MRITLDRFARTGEGDIRKLEGNTNDTGPMGNSRVPAGSGR